MSKTIILTIGERLAALALFDDYKGSITGLATIMDEIKKLVITQDEWTAANRTITESEGKQAWKWEESKEETWKAIDLDSVSTDYLAKAIKEKSDKNQLTLEDHALISLSKKLA